MFIKPDYNLPSIYDINIQELKQKGITALLFDLDSTIMASKSGRYLPETKQWLDDLKRDFFVAVVSNNHNRAYIEKVSQISDFPLLFNAKKPDTKAVEKFLSQHNIGHEKCAIIGDRPLTDILCGKRLKCTTILVDSITAQSEHFLVRFVRKLERLVVGF